MPVRIRIFVPMLSCLAATYSMPVDSTVAAVAPETTRSFSPIAERVLESQHRIKSLLVVYNVHYRQDGQMLHVERELALMSPCWMRHRGTKEFSGNQLHMGVLEQQAFLNGQSGSNVNAYSLNRLYFRRPWLPAEGLPGTLSHELFFTATGIWPIQGVTPPRPFGHAHVLTDVAESDEFILESSTTEVDGTLCQLVCHTDGTDRIWIAPSFGYNIVKREILDPDTGLEIRFFASDFSEVANNIWMPKTIRRTSLHDGKPVDAKRIPLATELVVKIGAIRVNDLDEGHFEFVPPPGAMRINHEDVTAKPLESETGAVEYMDDLSRWISEYLANTRQEPAFPAIQRDALLAGMIVGFVLLTLLIWKRSDRPARRVPSEANQFGSAAKCN